MSQITPVFGRYLAVARGWFGCVSSEPNQRTQFRGGHHQISPQTRAGESAKLRPLAQDGMHLAAGLHEAFSALQSTTGLRTPAMSSTPSLHDPFGARDTF